MTTFMQTGCKWVARTNALLWLFAACSACAQLTNPERWQSPLYQDHALVGRIYSVADDRFIESAELVARLRQAAVLMLGEKHDNPDHHVLQLAVLKLLQGDEGLGSISFEMLDASQADSVAQLNAGVSVVQESLAEFLSWDEEGWDWEFYGPLVGLAASNGIPIVAGNISRQQMSEVYRTDPAEFPVAPLSAAALAQLNQDIDDGHCGMLPESQFPAMLQVQQARDRAMAEAVASVDTDGKRVLIAGNYHARRDLGVLNYLPSELGQSTLSLSFIEVSPESELATDYVEATAGVMSHDFLWFTPALSNEDYCDSLRQPESAGG